MSEKEHCYMPIHFVHRKFGNHCQLVQTQTAKDYFYLTKPVLNLICFFEDSLFRQKNFFPTDRLPPSAALHSPYCFLYCYPFSLPPRSLAGRMACWDHFKDWKTYHPPLLTKVVSVHASPANSSIFPVFFPPAISGPGGGYVSV